MLELFGHDIFCVPDNLNWDDCSCACILLWCFCWIFVVALGFMVLCGFWHCVYVIFLVNCAGNQGLLLFFTCVLLGCFPCLLW